MYLNLLNEEQKELFLEVAVKLSSADGDYSDEERSLINEYCKEMAVEYNKSLENELRDTAELVSELSESSEEKEKRIILFELMGLCYSDGELHSNEQELLENICLDFGMEEEYLEECQKLVKGYFDFQNKANELIIRG